MKAPNNRARGRQPITMRATRPVHIPRYGTKVPLHRRAKQRYHSVDQLLEASMEWTKPSFEEINLNCEISSYANAEL
jgi:hypothetical protein